MNANSTDGFSLGPRIEMRDVSVQFDDGPLLASVTLRIARGEIVHVVGPNGSGKTALLNVLSAYVRPAGGVLRLRLAGRLEMTSTDFPSPEHLAAAGLGRTWQDSRLHPRLTVLENLLLADQGLNQRQHFMAALWWGRRRACEKAARQQAHTILARLDLGHLGNRMCGCLSVGEAKRVAFARVVQLIQPDPAILLLDEPLAGVDGASVGSLINEMRMLASRGAAVVIVEHRAELLSAVSTRTLRLEAGHLHEDGVVHA